jgi:LAS superfamily LD-carboxypeptidase LdcB
MELSGGRSGCVMPGSSSLLRNIPAFPNAAGVANAPQQPAGHRLYQRAQDAFVRMRAAAWTDGVPLIVLSSFRDPAVSRARAAAAGNPAAVASFSAHSLGLAVDLRMSFRYQSAAGPQQRRFAETTTRPMQNVVDMRQSPAHKWMMLRGAEFGWFPYQNEPWHWEFNPPNFRQEFHQAAAAAQPGVGGGRP